MDEFSEILERGTSGVIWNWIQIRELLSFLSLHLTEDTRCAIYSSVDYTERPTVAWWRSGQGVGLATSRSQIRVSAVPRHVTTWASCSHTCASVYHAV